MYGILCFTSKIRVPNPNVKKMDRKGVPFTPYKNKDNECIVFTRQEYHRDMWVKINEKQELMEIIGPVCDKKVEKHVLMKMFHIISIYPSCLSSFIFETLRENSSMTAYTVDDISTLDRDDAISIQYHLNGSYTLGIHIIDLVMSFGDYYPTFLKWSQEMISSVYPYGGESIGIFPKEITYHLSLTKGKTQPCLSLLQTYDQNHTLLHTSFSPRMIYITDNMTYHSFSQNKDATTLQQLTGKNEPEDLIAWCMIQYNMYYASFIEGCLLRVQEENQEALYSYKGTHASFGNIKYTHATSPIRRFADFYNQSIYYSSKPSLLDIHQLESINKKMRDVKEFHYREMIMEMAYQYKEKPMKVKAIISRVKKEDNERAIQIEMDKRKIYIPLYDNYYAEEICNKLEEDKSYDLSLFGVHIQGKSSLRIRLIE